MVEGADQDAVVECGFGSVGPSGAPVVGFALFGWFVAFGEGAAAVAGFQCLLLGLGEQALLMTVIQRERLAAKDLGDDPGVAGHQPCLGCGDAGAGGQGGGFEAVDQRVVVEPHDQGGTESAFAGELVTGQVPAQFGESHAEPVPVFQVAVVVGLRSRGVVVEVVAAWVR